MVINLLNSRYRATRTVIQTTANRFASKKQCYPTEFAKHLYGLKTNVVYIVIKFIFFLYYLYFLSSIINTIYLLS